VRFGDPETEVLLPALKTDLAVVVKACLEGKLAELELEFEEGYFVDVVQVSGGYPKSYEKGFPIHGLEAAQQDALVFQAGTRLIDGQLCNNGGRVLNIVAQGQSLQEAINKAYAACGQVQFEGHFYRKDIGQRQHKGLYKS
jgi:phosphoribosylamine--glycine ligase